MMPHNCLRCLLDLDFHILTITRCIELPNFMFIQKLIAFLVLLMIQMIFMEDSFL